MTDQLPEPMVPPEVDLRGLEYMPLLGDRLFSSDFDLDANDVEFRVGLRLWWAAWKQVPAGSLPKEDNRLRKLAGLDENVAKWRKVKGRALHGFVECSDGRLYHPIVAQQALIAWEKRAENVAERENEAERQRRSRAERKRMFEELRKAGVTPKWDISMGALRDLHALHVTPPVTVTGHGPDTPPVTRTATAKTGRDGTGQEIQEPSQARATSSADARADDPGGHQPTAAGAICRALRAAGVGNTNPGHPTLQVLLNAGATEAEFLGAVEKARDKRDPFAYVLRTVEGQRRDAAETAAGVHHGPMPTTPATDRKSRQLATAGLMTGAVRAQPQQEFVDVDARVIAPRELG